MKKLILVLFLLLAPAICYAGQPIMGSTLANNLPSNTTRYFNIRNYTTNAAAETNIQTPIAVAGTFKNLQAGTSADIAAGSYTFTYSKNGVTTSMPSVSISSGHLSTVDTSHSCHVDPGDRLTMQIIGSSGVTTATGWWCAEFVPDTPNEYLLFFGSINMTADNRFIPVGSVGYDSSTETSAITIVPASGHVDNLYTHVATAPGTNNGRTFTLYYGASGSTGAKDLTTTHGATDGGVDTFSYDTTGAHGFDVVAGNMIDVKMTYSAGTPVNSYGTGTMRFVPTTKGEYWLCNDSYGTAFTENYYMSVSGHSTWNSSEAAVNQLSSKNIYIVRGYARCDTAPASGKSFVYTLKDGSGNNLSPSFAITISDTSVTGTTTQNATIPAGSLVAWQATSSGSPSLRASRMSLAGLDTEITSGDMALANITVGGNLDVTSPATLTLSGNMTLGNVTFGGTLYIPHGGGGMGMGLQPTGNNFPGFRR